MKDVRLPKIILSGRPSRTKKSTLFPNGVEEVRKERFKGSRNLLRWFEEGGLNKMRRGGVYVAVFASDGLVLE